MVIGLTEGDLDIARSFLNIDEDCSFNEKITNYLIKGRSYLIAAALAEESTDLAKKYIDKNIIIKDDLIHKIVIKLKDWLLSIEKTLIDITFAENNVDLKNTKISDNDIESVKKVLYNKSSTLQSFLEKTGLEGVTVRFATINI